MSMERQPFVRVAFDFDVEHDLAGMSALHFGEGVEQVRLICDRLSAADAAKQINAAVEAREVAMMASVVQSAHHAFFTSSGLQRHFEERLADLVEERRFFEEDWVIGHEACGLAFDLGMEQGRTAAFAPLLDTLLATGGKAGALAFELAQALGLDIDRRNEAINALGLIALSDEDLLAEVERRGYIIRGIAIPPRAPSVPQNLPNLPSYLRPGQIFGVDPALGPGEAVRIRNIDRCTAEFGVMQCERPVGHEGPHRANNGQRSWGY